MNGAKFAEKIGPVVSGLGNEIHLRSLRDALTALMPLYLTAGLTILLGHTVCLWLLSGSTLAAAQHLGQLITNGILNISSLLAAPVIGYMLARNYGYEKPLEASLISLTAFVIMIPDAAGAAAKVQEGARIFEHTGADALLAGILIGLLASEIYVRVCSLSQKCSSRPGKYIPPAVSGSLYALFPYVLVIAGSAAISVVLNMVLHTSLLQVVTMVIQRPLLVVFTGLAGCVLLYSLGNLLWIFGIHQTAIYGSVLEPLLIINIVQNMAACAAGEAVPNIINAAFVPAFGMLGGSGSTMCLLFAVLLAGCSKEAKNVLRTACLPGLFNINEPVIFGYPVAYNRRMLIPFVLTPAMGIVIGYAATSLHFMNACVVCIPWITPPLLSGYLATAGDWRAVIVQAVILLLGTLLYLPFVKLDDAARKKTVASR